MPKNASLCILYHGHSNVEIHFDVFRLQIDPFYTSNPLADIKADAVNPTHILLSHAHFDHIEDAESLAKRTHAPIIANYEIATHFQNKGVPNTHPMNHGGGHTFDFGRATMTLAFHTSSFPDGSYGGQPNGWILEVSGKTLYFAGDTALFSDMSLIGKLWKIDLAFLPIGDNFTMGPDHALRAANMLRAKMVVPIHYNIWPLITQDSEAFAKRLKKKYHIKSIPMRPGDILGL